MPEAIAIVEGITLDEAEERIAAVDPFMRAYRSASARLGLGGRGGATMRTRAGFGVFTSDSTPSQGVIEHVISESETDAAALKCAACGRLGRVCGSDAAGTGSRGGSDVSALSPDKLRARLSKLQAHFDPSADAATLAALLSAAMVRFAASPPLSACSGCKRTLYCNEVCQRSHWRAGHKAVCGELRASCGPARDAAALPRSASTAAASEEAAPFPLPSAELPGRVDPEPPTGSTALAGDFSASVSESAQPDSEPEAAVPTQADVDSKSAAQLLARMTLPITLEGVLLGRPIYVQSRRIPCQELLAFLGPLLRSPSPHLESTALWQKLVEFELAAQSSPSGAISITRIGFVRDPVPAGELAGVMASLKARARERKEARALGAAGLPAAIDDIDVALRIVSFRADPDVFKYLASHGLIPEWTVAVKAIFAPTQDVELAETGVMALELALSLV